MGWVGWGGEVITFVGTFTHIPYYMFPRHAEPYCVDLNQTRNVCLLTRLAQDLALAIVIKDLLADLRCLRAGQPRESPRHAHTLVAAFEGLCLVWSCLTLNTNTVCCCCCCCCYIDMCAKITLVATT